MKTVKLEKPIEYGETTITELQIREPVAGDMRGIRFLKGGDVDGDTLLLMASRLSCQPPSVIDKMSWDDTQTVLEVVGNFMEGSRPTGNKP